VQVLSAFAGVTRLTTCNALTKASDRGDSTLGKRARRVCNLTKFQVCE
jgi:hypothetical protein